MKKIIKILSCSFFIILAFFLISSKPIFAQQSLPLVVYPAKIQLEVSPGEKTGVTVNFLNQSELPLSGYFRIADFIVIDNKGTPEIVEQKEKVSSRYAASSWFSSLYDRGTIPANDKVSYLTYITVPQDAAAGGHYVAIYFEPVPELTQPQTGGEKATAISTRLASLVYIKVKGEIKEEAKITRFFANRFQEYGPVKVITEILNLGNYHITPQAKLTLTNPLGQVVDEQKLFPLNIFPERSRLYKNELGKKWLIGRYQVKLTGTYGEKNLPLSATLYLWIFPWKVAIVVFLAIVILILLTRHLLNQSTQKEKELSALLEEEKEEIERLKKMIKNNNE